MIYIYISSVALDIHSDEARDAYEMCIVYYEM